MRVMLQDKESGVTTDWLVVNRDRTKYTLQDAGDSNKIIVLTAKDLVRMVNEVLSNPQPSEVTLPIGSEDVLPTGNEDLEPPAGTVGTVASEVVGSITSIVESHHIEPITIKQFESQFGEDGKPVNEPVLVPPVMDRSL